MVLELLYDFYSRRYHSTKICKNLIFWKILKWLINAKIQKITYLSVWQKFLLELRTLIPQNSSTNIWTFEWNPICVFITSRSKVTLWNRNTSCLMADCSELPNIPCVQELFKHTVGKHFFVLPSCWNSLHININIE